MNIAIYFLGVKVVLLLTIFLIFFQILRKEDGDEIFVEAIVLVIAALVWPIWIGILVVAISAGILLCIFCFIWYLLTSK